MKHVLGAVANDTDIIEVYLNVQTSNEDARQFYLKNGFIQTDMIPNYYKRIDPPDSFVLKKSLREGHEVRSSASANNDETSSSAKDNSEEA